MSAQLSRRLRAYCEAILPDAREYVGLHSYDGKVADLSPEGVRAGLARLGGDVVEDAHDEAHLSAAEEALRVWFGELEDHRRNPLWHVANMELASYDRHYAPEAERRAARRRHLAAWPEAVEAALASLDRVPRPVAAGLSAAVAGLAAGVNGDDDVTSNALSAHARLLAHVEAAARDGDPDASLGSDLLQRIMSTADALPFDLGRLAERADAERDRLTAMLSEACEALRPGLDLAEAVRSLQADHPSIDGVLDEARTLTEQVLAWTRESGLVPEHGGECLVGPAPPSRSWATAMMSPAAPFEDDGPSWYHVTPPNPSWAVEQQEEWLTVFSRTTLPAITVHEVAPGHFTHFRLLRDAAGDVRRCVFSSAFIEGWAHHAEELLVEESFRTGFAEEARGGLGAPTGWEARERRPGLMEDAHYVAGVAIEALVRVTRLAVSMGLHSGAMSMDDAIRRFEQDAFLQGSAARSEAARATFDPAYGRYTFGKFAILDARDRARSLGCRLHPPALPHSPARPRRSSPRPPRHRHRARLTLVAS